METSAKTGFNAQELFVEAAKILYYEYNKRKKEPVTSGETLEETEEITKRPNKCC